MMRIDEGVIHRIINDEDIEGLLAAGAPNDEYERETVLICARIRQLSGSEFTEDQVARIVTDAWNEMFGPFDDPEHRLREPAYRRVAQRILQLLEKA